MLGGQKTQRVTLIGYGGGSGLCVSGVGWESRREEQLQSFIIIIFIMICMYFMIK